MALLEVARLRVGLSASLLLASGCAQDAFRCASASQCQHAGHSGTCQSTGFCSFPDDDCTSGMRYGADAPRGLANHCVEPEDEDAGNTECQGETCPQDGSSTTTGSSNAATDGDSGSTSTSTTSVSFGSSAGSDASSGGGNDCPQIVDEFNDGIVDNELWTVVHAAGVTESSGTIRFAVVPQVGGVAGVELPALAFVDASVRVDVVQLSTLADFPFRLALDADAGNIEVSINGGESISVERDGITQASVAVGDPTDGVSLEIVSTLGSVYVSAGPAGADNLDLLPLGKFGLPYAADDVRLSLLAGTNSNTADAPPFSVQLDRFSYCSAE